MKLFHKIDQAGDTIVEVMVVLAILGLALSISYATANRGLQQSRNAEEHSEALGLLDSQLESLRAAYDSGVALPNDSTTSFCTYNPSNPGTYDMFNNPSKPKLVYSTAVSDSQHQYDEYPSNGKCNVNSLYHVSITYKPLASPINPYYDFLVRWDGLGSLGPQQEEITYRLN